MKKIWERIKKLSQKAVHIMTVIMLTIAYFTVFAATALILKILGKNQLIAFKRDAETYWVPRPEMKHTLEEAKKQG